MKRARKALFYFMDFSAYINYLTFEKRVSPHSITAASGDLRDFSTFVQSFFGELSPSEISHTIIRSWMAGLIEQGLNPRSVHRKASTLSSFFRYLLREGKVNSSPMKKVVLPKKSKRLPVFINESRMDTLFTRIENLDCNASVFTSTRNQCILEIFYATGMRLSELVNLKTGSFSGNTVKVMGKRSKERIIPVTRACMESLAAYLSEREKLERKEEGYLFLTEKGKKIYPNLVYKTIKYYLSAVTSENKKSPHVLRHTFATHMLNNGADLNAIKELLGHTSLAATQVYTHNTIDKLKNIYKQAHPSG